MSAALTAWRDAGRFVSYRGHRIFVRSESDISDKPVLLLIHGFPTAGWDWHKVWDALAGRYRLIAPDMIGFGFSDKPRDYSYSLHDQADLIEVVLKAEGVSQYHVLAHDYGDSVAQELLARDQERLESVATEPKLRSVCFLNGGLFPETHHARPVQKVLNSPLGFILSRLVSRRAFHRTMSGIFGPQSQPSSRELDDFWALVVHKSGHRIGHKLIRYIGERRQRRERWVQAMQQTQLPLRLIDGIVDPVSGGHMVERYRELLPDADVVELPVIGHYPQCEAPMDVVRAYLEWRSRFTLPTA